MSAESHESPISNPDWATITPMDFWEKADQVQDDVLKESDVLFSQIVTASPEAMREILIQYRYFTVYYIPDLALMLARLDDGPLRSFLADILYDELGGGKAENAHPVLYDNFLKSIGVTDIDLEIHALSSNVALLDEARNALVDPQNSTDYAVGLRGMGGECVCQVYISQLHKWLLKNPFIAENMDKTDWVFWDLHVGEHDIEHRIQTRAMIDQEIVQPGGERLEQLGAGYMHSMLSWRIFWENIFKLQDANPNKDHSSMTRVKSTVDVKVLEPPVANGQVKH